MIRLSNVTLRRGVKALLEGADVALNPGERIGLIGANGSGKSSLFALLRGELHADRGEVDLPGHWRISHVAQETPALERSALDYAIDGDTRLRALEEELSIAEEANRGERIAELHAALGDADAYTARPRAERLLTGLGFRQDELERPVSSFSGGWRMRLNLAQALMAPSQLLLLDEPTNHLDLDAIVWLEDWLRRYPGTLVVVSHDRDFLDGVVDVVVHIDARKLRRYSGDYSGFEAQRAQQVQLAAAQYEKQQRERAHLQSFIDRFRAKATKARQAQSRMKMLAKMEELAPLHAAAPFSFEFREPLRAPDPLLVLEDVAAGYGEKLVLSGVTLSIRAEQRIGLVGVNGAGKSTLIKTIAGALAPLAGSALFNKGVAVGYFAQHQVEMLRDDQSPLWHLQRISESSIREQQLRDYLGSFNFPGDMATGPVENFSGGEKARLALALIVWQRPNLLLLDEPTNHLDLETREALAVALAQFEGTLVLVSHDRHLLRATTEQLLVVRDGRVEAFDGDLDEYRDAVLQGEAGRKKPPAQPAKAVRPPTEKSKNRLSRVKRLEEQMAKLGERKAALEAELGDPGVYRDAGRVRELLAEQAYAAKELEALENEWLEINA
ncbi:MAG TPA: ATP-binding cassette domain-containing protein [Burkholderiales bacterium]|nr:ATP-binding cassette domain-containing protein [Burkholderiales bacterium]